MRTDNEYTLRVRALLGRVYKCSIPEEGAVSRAVDRLEALPRGKGGFPRCGDIDAEARWVRAGQGGTLSRARLAIVEEWVRRLNARRRWRARGPREVFVVSQTPRRERTFA
jgi:hypothetical protein